MLYKGVITVIPTFFTKENMIDLEAITNHIEIQKQNDIKTIVLLGTTSETPTLKENEKIQILQMVNDKFSNCFDIIVGLSGNETESVLNEALALQNFVGAFMLSAPYYNKPSQEGIYQHYKKIIETINKDFVIYNVPSRTGVNIEPETIARLYNDFDNVKAIKEASGSVEQVIKIKSLSDIEILSGDDGLILPFMALGATGVISVVSNIIPQEISYIVKQFSNGNHQEAMEMFYRINNLIKLCFIESNPVPLKYIINRLYNNKSSTVRLPLVEISNKNRLIIDEYISNNINLK